MSDDVIPQSEPPDQLDSTPMPVKPRPQTIVPTTPANAAWMSNIDALAKQPFRNDFTLPPTDTPKNVYATPGAIDVDHGSDAPDRPAWTDTLAAEFQHGNTIASTLSSDALKSSKYADPNFDTWGAIKGTPYEPFWSRFADAQNQPYVDAIKRDIDREQQNQKTMALAPWWQSMPFGLLATGADWPMLIPGGAFVKGAKGGVSLATGMAEQGLSFGAATALQEAALQQSQQTRTLGESIKNVAMGTAMGALMGTGKPLVAAAGLGAIQGADTAAQGGSATEVGASALLGIVLGAAGARSLSHEEWRAGVDKVNADIARAGAEPAVVTPVAPDGGPALPSAPSTEPASAGAAAVSRPVLQDYDVAGTAAKTVAEATRGLNPLLRLTQSESPVMRQIANQLMENPLYLRMNREDGASPQAVVTLMKEAHAGLADAMPQGRQLHQDYRKAGGQMPLPDFLEEVGKAMRRGDESDIPQVAAAAKIYRAKVFEPLKVQAIEAGLLKPDVDVSTAASYFTRKWSSAKINQGAQAFTDRIAGYFHPAIKNEFVQSAQALKSRLARLDEETQNLGLGGDDRAYALNRIDARLSELQQHSMTDAADRLSEIRSQIVGAGSKEADFSAPATGNFAADEIANAPSSVEGRRAAHIAALKDERAKIMGQGGDALASHLSELASLRRQRDQITGNTAGQADRAQKIYQRIADLEDANQRSMQRLIAKGQQFERDTQKLDPTKMQERVSQLRDAFAAEGAKADAAADQLAKHLETARTAEGAPKDASIGRVAAIEKAQRARAARMNSVAERLDLAENFDRQGALDEVTAGVERLKEEVNDVSIRRGEQRANLLDQMRKLDPQKNADRLKAIEQIRRDHERAFYDRWETDRQGGKIDLDHPEQADFTEAAKDIAEHLFNTFTGRGSEGVRPEYMSVNIRGPMKERTLNVPDAVVEDFLEHNVEEIAHGYTRTMSSDIELAKKFGTPDMGDAFARVREDFKLMRSRITDPLALDKLSKLEKEQIKDLEFVRDNVRGTRTPNTAERSLGKAIRTVNNLNYLRSMGKVVVGSLADAARPAMVHGLLPYMATVPKLMTNLAEIRMSAREARLAGNASEAMLGHRMATLTEITDPLATRGPIEVVTHNLVEVMNKWNGIRIWTDWMKSFSSVMVQNRILANVQRDALNPREQAYMRYLGLDQSMSERIAAQFAEHGETQAGIHVAGTDSWTDPQAVRAYRAAMNKDVDSIIVQPGPGDVPCWATTASGKMILQFKTFTLASHQRVFLRGLQEGPARFIGGMVALTTAGIATRYLQAISTNNQDRLKEYASNPGKLIGEGLDAGGGLALLMEGANTFEQATSVNPIKDPLAALTQPSGPAKPTRAPDPSQLLTGPAGGLLDNAAQVMFGANEAMHGRTFPNKSARAATHLLPFSTAFGVQEFLNYLVAPPTQH